LPRHAWIHWSTVAAAVLVAAFAAGCGASSGTGRMQVSAACLAEEREKTGDTQTAPDAHLTDEERERAEAQGAEVGEEPGLNADIVELFMQEYGVSADEAMHRNEIQARSTDAVDSAAKRAAGEYYGGAWFDPDNGGKYTVAVARGGDVAAVEAALKKRGMSEDSAVVVVESSYADLDKAQEFMANVVDTNVEETAATISVDPVGNCVVVTVDSDLPSENLRAIGTAAADQEVDVLVKQEDLSGIKFAGGTDD
jgi:glycine cleavage system H lipoate-binding protein